MFSAQVLILEKRILLFKNIVTELSDEKQYVLLHNLLTNNMLAIYVFDCIFQIRYLFILYLYMPIICFTVTLMLVQNI